MDPEEATIGPHSRISIRRARRESSSGEGMCQQGPAHAGAVGAWQGGHQRFQLHVCLLVCRVDVRCFVEGMETQGAVGRETMAGLMVRREDRQMRLGGLDGKRRVSRYWAAAPRKT